MPSRSDSEPTRSLVAISPIVPGLLPSSVSVMATFVPYEIGHTDAYKLMTGLVVPRPIGWIGTVDDEGRPNLAPYSFFQCVATNPPVVIFSAGITDGHEKDSLLNARTTGEFTCNLVDATTAEAMNKSAAVLELSLIHI